MERYAAVACYLLVGAAALAIILTLNNRVAFTVGEADRTVFGVVDCTPDTGFGLNERLVAVGVKLRHESGSAVLGNSSVLIELVSIIHRNIISFSRLLLISCVVVGVIVLHVIHHSTNKFGAVVVCEGVVHGLTVTSGIARSGTTEDVVAVGSLSDECRTAMIVHAGEQVTSCLVGLSQRHVVRLGRLVLR